MRINIVNHLVCPTCHTDFSFLIHRKTKERIIEGELKCKKCGRNFYVRNEIVCFDSCRKKQFERDAQKLRKTTVEQEIPQKWMRLFSKQELAALKREWNFLLSVIKKNKSTIHLDFATGTGRFLRNIISKTKGEIVALDNGLGTCQELQYFLKRIKKYDNVSIVCADARKMPFRNVVFDSVSSWCGIEELKMKNAVKESKRVLKDGGVFILGAIHYQKRSKSFLLAKKYGVRFITKEEIIKILKKNKFHNIEQKIFFKGYTGKSDFPLPTGDFYLMDGIKASKLE
jgi:SAM-dependent methyltransferase